MKNEEYYDKLEKAMQVLAEKLLIKEYYDGSGLNNYITINYPHNEINQREFEILKDFIPHFDDEFGFNSSDGNR